MPRSRKGSIPTTIYSFHPGVAMIQKWIAELPQKTGKTLDEWMHYIQKSGPASEKERREWLKKEHGLGTNTAWWLAERASGNPMGMAEDDPESYLQAAEKYVEAMFTGSKAGLRPIYDELLKVGLGIGPEAKACPCKTIVPLYRKHVFAEIKPATRTRIDLGFALARCEQPLPARMIDTGGLAKKDRITHRIPITSRQEIDAEVKHWLKIAYDLDA